MPPVTNSFCPKEAEIMAMPGSALPLDPKDRVVRRKPAPYCRKKRSRAGAVRAMYWVLGRINIGYLATGKTASNAACWGVPLGGFWKTCAVWAGEVRLPSEPK